MSMDMDMNCDCCSDCNCGPNCDCTPENKCCNTCACDSGRNTCACGPNCNCTSENKCCDTCACDSGHRYVSENKCIDCSLNKQSSEMVNPYPNNYNMNIQQIFPAYATSDPNNPITSPDGTAELIIAPHTTYFGPVDGFQNDNLMNFSVGYNKTEKWYYHNLDTQDTHPFHFHLTSGFVDCFDEVNSQCLLKNDNYFANYLYSRDTYGIGSQQSLAFYLKFINYISEEGALVPPVRNLGYMYHCHYMTHHDMNMMGQYYVHKNN
jgi:FtsP/CotA-like multicopper oxidase with cupredoxin domain